MINLLKKTFILFLSFSLFSCEKGELLNAEADILEVVLPKDMKVGKAEISNDKVRIPKLAVYQEDNEILAQQLKSLTPQFTLTPGATISDNGVARDFSQPQRYTVTSEDGKWKKEYEVSFYSTINAKELEFSFTYYDLFETSTKKKYYQFYELDEDVEQKLYVWSSGNGGFALTAKVSDPPESYPTFATLNGKIGSGAQLVTRSTGGLGALVGMPIAAGNLFLGTFEVSSAMSKPLEATQFGIQTGQGKPVSLCLWCKYKPGQEYKDNKGNVLSQTDSPQIYAVLYEPLKDANNNPVKLNGSNVQTADNIVSIAISSIEQANQITENNIETGEYHFIEIPFIDRQPFDPAKQASGKYYITVVFSSSLKGDLFEGAVGSTLYVDEVKLIVEE